MASCFAQGQLRADIAFNCCDRVKPVVCRCGNNLCQTLLTKPCTLYTRWICTLSHRQAVRVGLQSVAPACLHGIPLPSHTIARVLAYSHLYLLVCIARWCVGFPWGPLPGDVAQEKYTTIRGTARALIAEYGVAQGMCTHRPSSPPIPSAGDIVCRHAKGYRGNAALLAV